MKITPDYFWKSYRNAFINWILCSMNTLAVGIFAIWEPWAWWFAVPMWILCIMYAMVVCRLGMIYRSVVEKNLFQDDQ